MHFSIKFKSPPTSAEIHCSCDKEILTELIQKEAYLLFVINHITRTKGKNRNGRILKICGTVHLAFFSSEANSGKLYHQYASEKVHLYVCMTRTKKLTFNKTNQQAETFIFFR